MSADREEVAAVRLRLGVGFVATAHIHAKSPLIQKTAGKAYRAR
jgi:hypothetical protein